MSGPSTIVVHDDFAGVGGDLISVSLHVEQSIRAVLCGKICVGMDWACVCVCGEGDMHCTRWASGNAHRCCANHGARYVKRGEDTYAVIDVAVEWLK